MSDQTPKTPVARTSGLGPAAQRLQAAREKAAKGKTGGKLTADASASSFKAKSNFAGKKTSFQRKAV